MSYEEYKAKLIAILKTVDLRVFPEEEIDEFIEREDGWIRKSYNSYLEIDPQYFESHIQSLAYAMGLAF